MEDNAEDNDESEYGMRNDQDDEANEGREDDSETEAEDEVEDEVEDEADNMQAMINNERRGEIATLEHHIRDYNDRVGNESTPSGIMTLNMLINMAEGRCRELRGEIASSRQS